MGDASTRGWGPGWPHPDTSRIKTLVRADGLRLPMREELIPLVAWLIDETERRGYDIRPDWTWGFSNRPIRGTQTASNHSWGIAFDLNAPKNPMLYGKPGWQALHDSGRTDMPAWLPLLWEQYGFRWGGNYSSRQDAMHMEFMGTREDAARYIAQISKPTQPTKDWFDMATKEDLQALLKPLDDRLKVIENELTSTRDASAPNGASINHEVVATRKDVAAIRKHLKA